MVYTRPEVSVAGRTLRCPAGCCFTVAIGVIGNKGLRYLYALDEMTTDDNDHSGCFESFAENGTYSGVVLITL
jgi:hypothetical protein